MSRSWTTLIFACTLGVVQALSQDNAWNRFDLLNDGAVTCIAPAPNGDIYIATNQSGIHRSTDLGVTWQPVNTGINGTDVRVVAAAPNGDLYAAVCPDVAIAHDDFRAHGPFYVSTDHGMHWDSLAYVQVPLSIIVTRSGDIVLGNEGGRFVGGIDCSTDGGRTWSTRSPGGDYGMVTTVIGADSTDALYVAYNSGDVTGMVKTTDHGVTWAWNKTFGTLWAETSFRWTAMAVLPDGTVFAAGSAGRAGLFRISSDGTSVIRLDSAWSPNTLAALPDGSLIASDSAHIYRSIDQGITWITTASIARPTTTGFTRHPSGQLFIGAHAQEGYLYRSTDSGLSWTAPRPYIKNTFVPSLLTLPEGTILAGGRGTIYQNQGDPDEWNLRAAVYGFQSYYRNYLSTTWALYRDPNNRLLAGIGLVSGSSSIMPPSRGKIFESTDRGQTWQEMTSWSLSPSVAQPPPYCFTSTRANRALAGTSMGLFVLSDTRIWTLKSSATNAPVVALLTTPDGTVYAATRGQGVIQSTDDGESWSALNQGLTNLDGSTMTLDSNGAVCLGTAQGAFRLKPSASSWEKMGQGIPDIPLRSSLTMPDGAVCFGTSGGVYRLQGTFWEHSSEGLLSTEVTSLTHSGEREIIAGTWGAGAFHRTLPALPLPMRFTKVDGGAFLSDTSPARATAWGDYDRDGDPDLFIANGDGVNNQLYRYDGDAGFTKITVGPLVNDGGDSRCAAWGDYDNDGSPDIVIVNFDGPPLLYHNDGNGAFSRITSGAIASDNASGTSAAWADYDNDGRLDLFITHGGNTSNALFHGNADGSFTRIQTGEIVSDAGNSMACAWGDYDDDGFADLFVANAGQPGFLYHNNADGTFARIFTTTITSQNIEARDCGWIDVNNDGRMDLWIVNGDRGPMLLYRNDGKSTFTEILGGYVWTDATTSQPLSWSDFDNDGDHDFFLVGRTTRSCAYVNDGTGRFTRMSSGMPMLGHDVDGPVTCVDYSGDGNPDLVIANATGPRELYLSDGIGHAALRIQCAGTFSDSRGIGAKVGIKASIGGQSSWQYRSATGRDDTYRHFGLGDAATVDSVAILWPATGLQVLAPVEIDADLTVTEPSLRTMPILVYPPDRSTEIPTMATFRWRSSDGATGYHLQVATDSLFSSLVINDSTLTDTTDDRGVLLMSTAYFWRVRAAGTPHATPWTMAWRFASAMPVPQPPLLASPDSGAIHQPVAGMLTWRVASGSMRYHVQVADDPLYTRILVNDSTLADTSKAYAGTADMRYHWRVRAINTTGSSAYGSSWTFRTVPLPPEAPILITANYIEDFKGDSITLAWSPALRGEHYQLHISDNYRFEGPLVLNDSALTDTVRKVPVSPGTYYCWRVRAVGTGGAGPYSEIRNFKTFLAPPTLLSPEKDSIDLPTNLTLRWRRVPGAIGYVALVGQDSTLYTPAYRSSSDPETTTVAQSLRNETWYYWKVRALVNGRSSSSPVWRFRTAKSIPIVYRPADGATNQPTSLPFAWQPTTRSAGYHLQISTSDRFDSSFAVNDSTIKDTSITVSGLLHMTVYYWRVRGLTVAGPGEFTGTRVFVTGMALPSKPEVSAPGNNVALDSNTVAFVWNRSIPEVSRYWHELGSDSTFALSFIDSTIIDTTCLRTGIPNGTHWWRVRARNAAGWGPFSNVRKFSVTVTGTDEPRGIPTVYALEQNFPNPFNPTTTIRFSLPAGTDVRLVVYNALGQQVRSLVDQPMDAGYHSVKFDCAGLPSGMYFYRLRAGTFVETKRSLLIK